MNVTTDSLKRGKLKEISLLWSFLAPYKKTIAAAMVALVIASGAGLAIPQAIRHMVDIGFSSDQVREINFYFIVLFGVAVILAVAMFWRYYMVTWLGERVVADIRKAVFERVLMQSPTFFETNRTGDILSRLTADTTVIQSVVGSSASIALRNMLTLIGGLIFMAFTSLRLLALVLLVVPLIVVPILLLGRRVRLLSRKSQDRIADASAVAGEVVGAVQVVQSFNQEVYENKRFGDYVENAFHTAVQRIRVRAWLTGFVIFLVFGAVDLVLWVGAKDVMSGAISGGTLTAFVIYAVLVAAAVGALSEIYGELQRAAGAAGRCVELIGMEPDIKAPESPKALPDPVKGHLEFRQAGFCYPSRPEDRVLDDFSLTVQSGETIAIVGPSGAGKSTLFQVLQRFYDIDGSILLDGVPIAEADPAEVRAHMAIVPQETVVFAASVQENIRYGRPDATAEMIRQAAEAAQALEFIDRLPEGMDTWLGERGTRLSGGQRQRIAIARAILRDAPVLLLDEATSSLDARSEKLVQTALDGLMKNRTTLVIAHRLATVLKVDRIVVMNQGRIVDIGHHKELLQKDGLYAEFAKLQFDL